MITTIKEITDLLTEYRIVIDQDHVNFCEQEFNRFALTRYNADSLVLEYDLIRNGYGKPPTHKAHDIQFGNIRPDFKEIFGRYHNFYKVKINGFWESKLPWMYKCASEGLVTHYAPYRVINRDRMAERKAKRIYQVGDELIISLAEFAEAKPYLKRAVRSQRTEPHEDRYIIVD